ncbi:hypothetical protein VTO73DRAFT_4471 [Trametes versicolor]
MMHLLNFVLAALVVTRGLAAPVDTAVQARDDQPIIWAPALGHPTVPITPAMGHPDVAINAPALGHPIEPVAWTPALGGDLHLKRNEPTATMWTPAMGHPSEPVMWTPAMGHPEESFSWTPAMGHPDEPVMWTPAMGGDLHLKRDELDEPSTDSTQTVANPWATRTAANAIPTWLTRGPAEAIPPWATRTAANAIPTWLTRGPPGAAPSSN